jgi:hypothetical protein
MEESVHQTKFFQLCAKLKDYQVRVGLRFVNCAENQEDSRQNQEKNYREISLNN